MNLSYDNKGLTSLPTFYKQLIEFWELTSIGICDEPSFILNQSVWNNKHITKSGSPLYDTTLSNKGINYIKDIFNTITVHVILNYGTKSKASSDFQRVLSFNGTVLFYQYLETGKRS